MRSYRIDAQKSVLTIYDTDTGFEAKNRDTFTCHHCGTVVLVKPKCDPADLGGLCKTCMKLICHKCAAKGGCDPWEKQMERMEARERLYAAATGMGDRH
jgi:hypothetical protein